MHGSSSCVAFCKGSEHSSQLLGQLACRLYTVSVINQHTAVGHKAQLIDVDSECGTACGAVLTACGHTRLDLVIEIFTGLRACQPGHNCMPLVGVTVPGLA